MIPPLDRPRASPSSWDGSWEGARRSRLLATLAATPAQRLAWLEEAIAIAYASGALPRRARADPSDNRG